MASYANKSTNETKGEEAMQWWAEPPVSRGNDNGNMRLHAPRLRPRAARALTETDVARWRHGWASDSRDNSQ